MNKCASIILCALAFALAAGEGMSQAGALDSHKYSSKPLVEDALSNRSKIFDDTSADFFGRSVSHLDHSMDRAVADIHGDNQASTFRANLSMPLNNEWNLVARPVLPLLPNDRFIAQFEELQEDYRLGDMTFMTLLSPATQSGSFIWGLGSTITLPTATEDSYGAHKWQVGPAAAGFYLGENWMIGILSEHRWSFAGDGDSPNVSQTIMQYFFEFNVSDRLDIGMAHHVLFNWNTERGYVSPFPFDLNEARTFSVGRLPVKLSIDGFFEVSANYKF